MPMFAGSRMRDAASAAKSSIQSLLDAMDSREESERQLREYSLRWKSLEAEYRDRSNI